MATVTPPARTWNPEESHRRVAHPLQKLRGYIRGYVSAEGAAVLLLYLAVWFWLGLLLDYGFFKVFTVDAVTGAVRSMTNDAVLLENVRPDADPGG